MKFIKRRNQGRHARGYAIRGGLEGIVDAVDMLIGLLMLVALALGIYSDRELETAMVLLIIATACVGIRWVVWSLVTQHLWWVRVLVGASVGGFILGALPLFLEWTKQR